MYTNSILINADSFHIGKVVTTHKESEIVLFVKSFLKSSFGHYYEKYHTVVCFS